MGPQQTKTCATLAHKNAPYLGRKLCPGKHAPDPCLHSLVAAEALSELAIPFWESTGHDVTDDRDFNP
jgi:hypothetical protein